MLFFLFMKQIQRNKAKNQRDKNKEAKESKMERKQGRAKWGGRKGHLTLALNPQKKTQNKTSPKN